MSYTIEPITRWVGNKRKLAPVIAQYFPKKISGVYHEPFIGMGGMFLRLLSEQRFALGTRIYLTDLPAIENLWSVLLFRPLHELWFDAKKFERANYAHVCRVAEAGDGLAMLQVTRRAYRGLVRFNQSGLINTPCDKIRKPITAEEVCAWAAQLRELCRGLIITIGQPVFNASSVVYLDPPYLGTFNAYSGKPFTYEQQAELAELARIWAGFGARILASNSPAAAPLYHWCSRIELERTEFMRAGKRAGAVGKVAECLFLYPLQRKIRASNRA